MNNNSEAISRSSKSFYVGRTSRVFAYLHRQDREKVLRSCNFSPIKSCHVFKNLFDKNATLKLANTLGRTNQLSHRPLLYILTIPLARTKEQEQVLSQLLVIRMTNKLSYLNESHNIAIEP